MQLYFSHRPRWAMRDFLCPLHWPLIAFNASSLWWLFSLHTQQTMQFDQIASRCKNRTQTIYEFAQFCLSCVGNKSVLHYPRWEWKNTVSAFQAYMIKFLVTNGQGHVNTKLKKKQGSVSSVHWNTTLRYENIKETIELINLNCEIDYTISTAVPNISPQPNHGEEYHLEVIRPADQLTQWALHFARYKSFHQYYAEVWFMTTCYHPDLWGLNMRCPLANIHGTVRSPDSPSGTPERGHP